MISVNLPVEIHHRLGIRVLHEADSIAVKFSCRNAKVHFLPLSFPMRSAPADQATAVSVDERSFRFYTSAPNKPQDPMNEAATAAPHTSSSYSLGIQLRCCLQFIFQIHVLSMSMCRVFAGETGIPQSPMRNP
jgi:hypothetical protein